MMLEQGDLRALVAMAEHGHFGRAAAALGVSQPALTKRIRGLEARLGGSLFERHARGASPTDAGLLLCERARQLLEETAAAVQQVCSVLSGRSGPLRIGTGLSVMLSGLPEVIRAFRKAYPEVQVTVRDLSTRDQVTALRRGELDVGFVRMGREGDGLQVWPVMSDELRLACRRDRRQRGKAELFREPLVTVSRAASPTYHDHVLATCRAAGYQPPAIQEANQLLTVLTLVQSGIGIGLVPASTRALALPGIRLLDMPLRGGGWRIGVASKPGASAAAGHFLAMVRQRFQPLQLPSK